ncbi:hypothetical protein [uncultured Legionella sp.]|uniref:hypothetical protein n=1 Tax=uncultured Legionella sp. TaxID=210934 RepID=UPI00262E351B|nr:hypothetical protein [uncultured Legionella sp.]
MNRTRSANYFSQSLVFIFFLIIAGFFYTSPANANSNTTSMNGTQLAYFIGYHTYGRSSILVHPRPVYRASGAYWTSWRTNGFRCQQRCLIDKWTRLVIQCNRRC